jgi:hypothetical protein
MLLRSLIVGLPLESVGAGEAMRELSELPAKLVFGRCDALDEACLRGGEGQTGGATDRCDARDDN